MTVLERMMEAEPSELRGEGGDDLAAHLRSCPRCRAVAETFLREAETLDRALTGLGQRRAEAVPVPEPIPIRPGNRWAGERARGSDARRRTRWRWAAPLAAAAALAAALVLRSGGPVRGPAPRPPAGTGIPATAASISRPGTPLVQAPSARNVMIFKTDDPNITIIWLD